MCSINDPFIKNRLELLVRVGRTIARLNEEHVNKDLTGQPAETAAPNSRGTGPVNVTAAAGTLAPLAGKRATATIAIVMTAAGDSDRSFNLHIARRALTMLFCAICSRPLLGLLAGPRPFLIFKFTFLSRKSEVRPGPIRLDISRQSYASS
jgi:hypothetical protein